MNTILTIIADPARAQMYESLARMSGAEVIHADGALHALTQLERTPADVIVCDPVMEDMSGEDFRMVVQEELASTTIPVFLLPDPEELQGRLDLVTPAPSGPEVLSQILQIVGLAPEQFAVPLNRARPAQLSGDLGPFALTDLLNWVSEMRFQGHWLVTICDHAGHERTGHLLMDGGNVTYAEYAGLMGKGALFALLRAIATFPQTRFAFYKTEELPAIRSADLKQTTARLLMELAVDLDHLSAQHSHN